MDGSFACPECGCVIKLTGLAPGRKVRCDWCRTLVEAPFLPRAETALRLRHGRSRWKRRRWPAWTRPVTGVLLVAIGAACVNRYVQSRWQSAEAQALSRLVASATAAESDGRLQEALSTLEGAISLAASQARPQCDLAGLKAHRDTLSLREAEARLVALNAPGASSDPGRDVGQALTLEARLRTDPALACLTDRIEQTLERLRLRWAETDSLGAERAADAGRFDETLELSGRQYRTADRIADPDRQRLQAAALARAARVIGRYGVVIKPVQGHFTLGSPASYDPAFRSAVAIALRGRGFVPRPAGTDWDDLWNSEPAFEVSFGVTELQNDVYLQSPNRLSLIEARLVLAGKGEKLWSDTFKAQTHIPLPGLPAYQASRLAVSGRRSPDFERVLYENARQNLIERLNTTLNNLPPCPPNNSPVPDTN